MSASAPTSAPVHDSSIDPLVLARLDLVPALRSRHSVVELAGGITNRNYKVGTPEGTYVARVSTPDGALLSIDRDAEHLNSVAAERSGAGAPVIDYVPDAGVLVVGFLEGTTFTEADVRTPANLPRIADACRLLHSGPRFVNDFNMFRIQESYLAIVTERGFRLPDGYRSYANRVAEIERAMNVRPEPTVPCNNDLLAGNMIDDGRRLWLIDYEYSGNNDACFELGNIWSESTLPLPLLDELVASYYGRRSARLVARARLWGLMSKYGWTLWASIQEATSAIDFDFWSWGMEKYDRAVPEFEGPDLDRLLEEVASSPD
jgi:thiamine kinase-like enzyme